MKRRPPSKTAKSPLRDASRGIRLHKALADLGVASRRASESLVQEGRVAVNGETITTLPAWVDPTSDRIEVDGRVVNGKSRGGHYYIMVNKPRAVICTNHDPEGRRSIIDLVPFDRRLFCVGRLDHDSTGLTLLTDDGDLAHRLTHPRYGIPKTYRVTIKGFLEDDAIERLRSGIWLGPRGKQRQAAKAQAAQITIVARDRERTVLLIELREGRNREIRRMLARFELKVRRLERIGLGPLKLKGVASGDWRRLTPPELQALRRMAADADRKTRQRPA